MLTVKDSYSLVEDDEYHRFYIDGVYQFTIEKSMMYVWDADDGPSGTVIFKKLVEAECIGEKAEDVCRIKIEELVCKVDGRRNNDGAC